VIGVSANSNAGAQEPRSTPDLFQLPEARGVIPLKPVCTKLVLAIDASGSTDGDDTHFAVQIAGHAAAFRDSLVHQTIEGCAYGAIAVAVFTWSARLYDDDSFYLCVPWTYVDSAEAALHVADAIEQNCGTRGHMRRGTDLSVALNEGMQLLDEAAQMFESVRNVIDVSGNGEATNGGGRPGLARARAQAEQERITVNSLVLDPKGACKPHADWLRPKYEYFDEYVTVGPASFTMCADDFARYAGIFLKKVRLEIAGRMPNSYRGSS
jgi:hypothetical protein